MPHRSSAMRQHGLALLWLLLFVVGGAWVADGVWPLLVGDDSGHDGWMAATGLALFVLGAAGLYHLRFSLLTTTATESTVMPPDTRVLVLGLSHAPPRMEDDVTIDFARTAASQARRFGLTLRDACEQKKGGDNHCNRADKDPAPPSDTAPRRAALRAFAGERWQQPLRALLAGAGQVEHVVLLTSHQSQDQVFAFLDLVAALAYPPGGERPAFHIAARLPGGHTLDFNDYNQIVAGAEHAIRFATASRDTGGLGCRHREICFDVTAGTKPFSVAVAAVTLNQAMCLCYVDNDGTVRFYNTSLSLPGLIGG